MAHGNSLQKLGLHREMRITGIKITRKIGLPEKSKLQKATTQGLRVMKKGIKRK